jgi:hypothetical protein
MHPQLVGNQQQVTEFHLLAGFHALDRRPVESGDVSEGLLGEVLVEPPDPDAVADGLAGIDDPSGLLVGHLVNALPTMIISQQQFCGTLRS